MPIEPQQLDTAIAFLQTALARLPAPSSADDAPPAQRQPAWQSMAVHVHDVDRANWQAILRALVDLQATWRQVTALEEAGLVGTAWRDLSLDARSQCASIEQLLKKELPSTGAPRAFRRRALAPRNGSA